MKRMGTAQGLSQALKKNRKCNKSVNRNWSRALRRGRRENQVCHFLGLIHLDKMSSGRKKK